MKRIYYFDSVKGILILCVILGHTLSTTSAYYNFDYDFFKIITFFMMPTFLFVTGYFAKKSHKSPLERALKLLKYYIIFQTLITLYYAFGLKIIDFDWTFLFTPRYSLWYLLTCTFLYLSEYLIKRFNFKKLFIISLILALGCGFIPFINDFLSLSRTITAFPMFLLGYKASEIDLNAVINKYKRPALVCSGLLIIVFFFNNDLFTFKDIYLKYSYYIDNNPFAGFIKRILLYGLYIIFSLAFLNLVTKKKTILTTLGSQTLYVYLFHGAIIKTVITLNLLPENPFLGTIITYIIVFGSSLIISLRIIKIKKTRKIIIYNKKRLLANEYS